jgi:hypothetical protein
VESEQLNLMAADWLSSTEKRIYELVSTEAPRHMDDLVETSGLNSSEVLATLSELGMKGIIGQLPGKQFVKVLFVGGEGLPQERPDASEMSHRASDVRSRAALQSID